MGGPQAFTTVRLAPGDVVQMREANALYARIFDDPVSYATEPPRDVYLEALLADANFVQLVAHEESGSVIGALSGYVLRKFERERAEIYIYDLAVDVKYRRQGVATALIGALQPIAEETGAWMIYVQADPEDAPALGLYDKLGIRENVFHFDIAVR